MNSLRIRGAVLRVHSSRRLVSASALAPPRCRHHQYRIATHGALLHKRCNPLVSWLIMRGWSKCDARVVACAELAPTHAQERCTLAAHVASRAALGDMYAARIAPWVLAALAAAAAAAASAPAQARCTIASYGIINDNPHPLPRVILVPGRTDWDVRIQPVCPDEVGVLVTVCDWDVEPLARVEGLGEVRVRRRGEGRGEAVLDAVVYCVAGDGDRARDEDEDGPGTETGAATSGTTPKAEEDPELERDEK